MTDHLWDLSHKARQAESDRELGFVFVNDTLALAPYRQAALWLADEGVWSLSGVVQVDANVPHAQWLDAVARHLQAMGGGRAEAIHRQRSACRPGGRVGSMVASACLVAGLHSQRRRRCRRPGA